MAVVDFQFQGRQFKSLVAVAREDTLCGRVLYSEPMDDSMAAKLLMDAASVSDVSESGAGQLRGARNIQTSASADAGSADSSVGASESGKYTGGGSGERSHQSSQTESHEG